MKKRSRLTAILIALTIVLAIISYPYYGTPLFSPKAFNGDDFTGPPTPATNDFNCWHPENFEPPSPVTQTYNECVNTRRDALNDCLGCCPQPDSSTGTVTLTDDQTNCYSECNQNANEYDCGQPTIWDAGEIFGGLLRQ